LRAASKILLLACRSGLTVFEFAEWTASRRLPPADKAGPWISRSHKTPPAPSTAPAFRVRLGRRDLRVSLDQPDVVSRRRIGRSRVLADGDEISAWLAT